MNKMSKDLLEIFVIIHKELLCRTIARYVYLYLHL